MSKKTKRKKEVAEKTREKVEDEQKSLAAQAQKEKKYYYDDAYGYEIYNSEAEEETDENS